MGTPLLDCRRQRQLPGQPQQKRLEGALGDLPKQGIGNRGTLPGSFRCTGYRRRGDRRRGEARDRGFTRRGDQ
ncbi:hypothetical protein NDU88_006178 [Pleurodeles waltl]|uniref:Uncharacterized protein n=1 Tax=Pleurodeles waltl TaxID=8319 RepID=A0AAV7UKS1_PLEWA|nr:hypothetical protein NDU88_006178 [Pleurodeles waltl]